MDRIINRVLKESIDRFILNERLSSVLYHFTGISGLYQILESDSFKLKSSYGRAADDLHKSKKFYLSCTRQRNGLLGYSNKFPVRISLDGDLLNQRYEGGAVNYWGSTMGKQTYYDKSKYDKIDYHQLGTENEDRIFSDEPFIKDASKYIKRVDVLLRKNASEFEFSCLYNILRKSKVVFIYDNEKDFNYQTDNIINDSISNKSEYYDSLPNFNKWENMSIHGLSHMMSFFILVDAAYNDYKGYCAKMLRRYGLDDYISKVLGSINLHLRVDGVDAHTLDNIRTNGDNYLYEKSFLMLRDFLRERGFSNIKDAIKFVVNRNNGRNSFSDYDTEKEVSVFVFQPNGSSDTSWDNVIILHPEKTLFWDIKEFDYIDKRYFVEDIVRNIRSHKSSNDEKFYKYVQHFVKGNVTVSEMLSFLNKLDTYEDDIIDYIFSGKFKYIKVNYWRLDNYKYVNETDKKELEEMFIE